jgi:hypothetical protein
MDGGVAMGTARGAFECGGINLNADERVFCAAEGKERKRRMRVYMFSDEHGCGSSVSLPAMTNHHSVPGFLTRPIQFPMLHYILLLS